MSGAGNAPTFAWSTSAFTHKGREKGGCHLHLLLWSRPNAPTWHGHARDLRLGNAHVDHITPATPVNVLRTVGYVLGENESICGTTKHNENEPREKHKHAVVRNHDKTLAKHNPELLRGIELAKDKSLSDDTAFAQWPTFIQNRTSRPPESRLRGCGPRRATESNERKSDEAPKSIKPSK